MPKGSFAPQLAWSVFATCLALYAFTAAIEFARGEPYGPLLAAFFVTPAVGALVASRQPANPIGWLLIATGFGLGIIGVASEYAALSSNESLPLGAEAGWLTNTLFVPVIVGGALLVPLHFPDGKLLSPRWWPLLVLVGAATVFSTIGYAIQPGDLDLDGVKAENPFGVVGAGWVVDVGLFLLAASVLLTAISLVLRFRRAPGEERQQLKWFAAAAIPMVLTFSIVAIAEAFSITLFALEMAGYVLLFFALPASIGIAVLRYRLWDINLVIKRSLVYGTLWLVIAAIYIGAALLLGLAAMERVPVGLAIGLTVLATLLFQPARQRLEQIADRLVFGRREQPLAALHNFGELVSTAEGADDVADHLAGVAAVAAALSWIRVEVTGSTVVEFGQRREADDLVLPIRRGADQLGELRCQPLEGSSLKEEETDMLAALAGQAAIAISHAQLASRIVRAQEMERRRIERNIHDGAQQELVALVAKLGLARNLNGQVDHGQLLGELQEEVRSILANLRELAQGVYPSVLADGGLIAAVEDRCSRLPITVDLQVSPDLRGRRLDEDIEAAAYFVVAEALTNLLRHSGAASASVHIGHEGDQLTLEVGDSGSGFDPNSLTRDGGLKGLADRLRTVRGALDVESSAGRGTRLRATLPYRVKAGV